MSEMPPYILYANELRKEILGGKYGTEGGLPGIEELKRRSKLAPNTIYRALSLLVGERIIEQRDKAYYVNHLTIPMTGYVPPLHELVRLQRSGFTRNLSSVRKGLIPQELSISLGLPPTITVTLRERISGESDDNIEKPTCLLQYYYLVHVTEEQIARMNAEPGIDIWPELGPETTHCHDVLAARLPTSEEASHLKITELTPVIDLRVLISKLEDKTPLLIQQTIFVGKSFAYDYDYTRSS